MGARICNTTSCVGSSRVVGVSDRHGRGHQGLDHKVSLLRLSSEVAFTTLDAYICTYLYVPTVTVYDRKLVDSFSDKISLAAPGPGRSSFQSSTLIGRAVTRSQTSVGVRARVKVRLGFRAGYDIFRMYAVLISTNQIRALKRAQFIPVGVVFMAGKLR